MILSDKYVDILHAFKTKRNEYKSRFFKMNEIENRAGCSHPFYIWGGPKLLKSFYALFVSNIWGPENILLLHKIFGGPVPPWPIVRLHPFRVNKGCSTTYLDRKMIVRVM